MNKGQFVEREALGLSRAGHFREQEQYGEQQRAGYEATHGKRLHNRHGGRREISSQYATVPARTASERLDSPTCRHSP